MPVEAFSLDLGPFLVRIESLRAALLIVPQPFVVQQQLAEQVRQLVEDIASVAQPGETLSTGWVGSRSMSGLQLFGEDAGIIASFDGAERLKWVNVSDDSGLSWQFDYEAAFEGGPFRGTLGGLVDALKGGGEDELRDATVLRISVSRDAEVLSTYSLSAAGVIVDERDWRGHFERAVSLAADIFETETGEHEDHEDGQPEELEAGEGFDLPGGAMGGGILRGAVAGLAGAAAAAAARKAAAGTGDPGGGRRDTPVTPSSSPEEIRPQRPQQPALPERVDWFFAAGREKRGPLTMDELGTLLASGEIPPESLVWRAGMENWLPASELDELSRWMPRRPPDLPVSERQWFYVAFQQRVGPVPESHLKAWLASGQLPWDISVWREGLDQWLPASSIPELRS